jgi:hypothetical protein
MHSKFSYLFDMKISGIRKDEPHEINLTKRWFIFESVNLGKLES